MVYKCALRNFSVAFLTIFRHKTLFGKKLQKFSLILYEYVITKFLNDKSSQIGTWIIKRKPFTHMHKIILIYKVYNNLPVSGSMKQAISVATVYVSIFCDNALQMLL